MPTDSIDFFSPICLQMWRKSCTFVGEKRNKRKLSQLCWLEVKEEVKREVKEEVKREVKEEVKREVKEEVK